MGRQELLYKYPPDLSKAQKHRLANRIFKGVEKDPACPECECCDRKTGVQEVSVSCCYDKNQLAFLGPGIPLFFAYVRNCIIMLVVFTIIFAGYCLYSNLSSSYCGSSSTNCEHNIFNTISFTNKMNNNDLLSIQNYILLTFVVINIVLFQFFRYNFRQIEEECDDIINSPSDYAVILRRLPEEITKEDIERMVEQRRAQLNEQEKKLTENLKIDHIVLSYAMGEYTRIKEQNLEKFKQLIDEDKQSEFKPTPLPKLSQTAKLGIIVFAHQESKDFFLYKPSIFQRLIQFFCDPCTPLSNFRVKGERVSIERAPEPDDVVWQNSKISIKGAIFRKSIFNVIGALLLGAGGYAQYELAKLQNSITDQSTRQLLSIGLSILISVFNFIILQFLIISSRKERNETLTEFNTVLTVKISFFQFLNTGVFVVAANFLADISNFKITDTLPTDITIVMLTNAITPNFSLWLMTYFEIPNRIFRWMIRTEKSKVTQLQANQTWEGPIPEIPYKYAYVLKTIWLTAFYAPLVPAVIPISIIALSLNYMIEKYLYGFVYSVPNMLSSMVNDSAIELLEYFPLILSLGEFIIYIYMTKYDPTILPLNWSIPIYISIGLSLLNLLLPMEQLNKCIKLKNDDMKCPPYHEVEPKFEVTYEMTNPAYECKKKRNRDVFLFNHIFGGDGKQVAMDMSGFLGLNETDRKLTKDPLLDKANNGNNNILAGLMENNDKIGKNNPNNVITEPSKNPQNLPSNNQNEGGNPFAAFLQMNKNGQTNGSNQVSNNKNPSSGFGTFNPNITPENSNPGTTNQVRGQNPMLTTPNVKSNHPQGTESTASNLKKEVSPLQIGEPTNQTGNGLSQDKKQFKNITKDLDFKYNNSNQRKPQNISEASNLGRSGVEGPIQQPGVNNNSGGNTNQSNLANSNAQASNQNANIRHSNNNQVQNHLNQSQNHQHPNNIPRTSIINAQNSNVRQGENTSNVNKNNELLVSHNQNDLGSKNTPSSLSNLMVPAGQSFLKTYIESVRNQSRMYEQDDSQFIKNTEGMTANENDKKGQNSPQNPANKGKKEKKPIEIQELTNKKKAQLTSEENLTFLKTFPHREQQQQIKEQSKNKFVASSASDLEYSNSKFTKSGTVFYQKPQNNKSTNSFPHVEIYVPGIKGSDEKVRNQDSPQKKRSFGKDKPRPESSHKANVQEGPQQYSAEEIYNPRFGNKKPVDIDKLYGPPGVPNLPSKHTRSPDTYKKQQKDLNSYFS